MRTLNLLRIVAVAALATMMAPTSFAQLSTGVTVQVNLSSVCRWQGGGAPAGVTVDFGDYTAFQAGANPGSTTDVFFECTRGFGAVSPTVAWDGATSNGVVAGLQYTLTVTGPTRTPGSAATAALLGTADTVKYTLGGTMPGGQAGAGAGGAQTAARTLTVTF